MNKNLKLVALNKEDAKKEYEFLKNLPSQNGFENSYQNCSYDDFVNLYLEERINASKGIGLKPGYVADTWYFLYDQDEIVGVFKVRHYLNDFLKQGPGHIGYAIKITKRKMGYGTQGLALAIEKLKKMPTFSEDEIYLSCLKTNIGSLKVMLNNGGKIHHEDDLEYYVRIPRD